MFQSILEQTLIALPLILGAYITLSLMKLPDFGIESAYLLGAVGAFIAQDLPLPVVFAAALAGGAIVGLTVVFLNQCLKIPYLLASVVVNGFAHGSTLYIMKASVSRFALEGVGNEKLLVAGIALAMVVLVKILMRSEMGYAFAVHGNNPRFFANHRISRGFVMAVGVSCAHALAGLSGFLFALTSGVLDITMNFGIVMLCLTALMIGKLCVRVRKPEILIPCIGIAGYFLMQQTLLRLGLDLTYFNVFQAFFILGMLLVKMRSTLTPLDHLGV
ncbi:MAG: ABC transporter permease subunit [Parachlamydiaceae bacterium]